MSEFSFNTSDSEPKHTVFAGEVPRTRLSWSLVLDFLAALLASVVSLGIAAHAGWMRGGTPVERTMTVALACVAVLYVHLIGTYWHTFSVWLRTVAAVLWCVGVIAVMYGQVSFFVDAQQDAGSLRAATVPVAEESSRVDVPHGRSLTEIARDRAKVIADLARIEYRRCTGYCPNLAARKASLDAQLVVLDTQTAEEKRLEAKEDRLVAQAARNDALRASLHADPVALQLAGWVGATESQLELWLAVAYAVVLEGAAVMGWLMVSRTWVSAKSREPVVLRRASGSAIVSVDAPSAFTGLGPVADSGSAPVESADDYALDAIHAEVSAGRLQPIQKEIRKFLRCGQEKAGHLNRLYEKRFTNCG